MTEMHDIENEVYTKVVTALRTEFPDIATSGVYVKAPPSFPYVSIIQQDSSIIKRFWNENEEYDELMFEIAIYSNKTNTKKSECKAIAKVINDAMTSLNFRRTSLIPVPNLEDASIYRLVARYTAVTDGKYLYRR